jgi:hypothetical protein
MGKFKDLEIEIREMDFKGYTPEQIANAVGLSVSQIVELLESEVADPYRWADISADLDSEYYGKTI